LKKPIGGPTVGGGVSAPAEVDAGNELGGRGKAKSVFRREFGGDS